MATFTETMAVGNTNGVTVVDMLTGPASGRYVVRSVRIANLDTISHTVTIDVYISSVSYRVQKAVVPPDSTLSIEDAFVLAANTSKIRVVLGAVKTTTEPQFIVTYGVIT
jgi:hypothetical protein